MPGIIWLASYPKSGNTWMRAFLANYLSDPDRPLRINDLPQHGFGDSQVKHFEALAGKPYADLSVAEAMELRARVQDWFLTNRAEDVFVKTHSMIALVKGQPLISPKATVGAVYVVRNPLDVAASFAHHFQIPAGRAVEILCDRAARLPASETTIDQYIGSWSRNVRTWLDADGLVLHVARFEDMLRRSVETFGEVVRFLNLPFADDRLERAVRFTSFDELRRQESQCRFVEGHEDGRKFFREGRIGSWRDCLSTAERDRIIEVHGPLMRHFGYLDEKAALIDI